MSILLLAVLGCIAMVLLFGLAGMTADATRPRRAASYNRRIHRDLLADLA